MRYACITLFIAILVAAVSHPALAQTPELSESAKLQLQVDALSSLDDLNLTPEQLSALKDLASDTAGTLTDSPTAITEAYKTSLKEMREALLTKDDDKIDAAEEKMGDIADKEDPDSEPDVDQSESAKSKAETLVKMLTVSQVAAFIAQNGDDVDNPSQLLLDAIHQCRGMSADDFQGMRDDTAQEIGIYAAGINPAKPPAIVGKINRLLTRVHGLSDDEYSQQQSSLEDEARKLVAGLDPINTLRHWLEDEMADVLSNPQLLEAINEWSGAGNK